MQDRPLLGIAFMLGFCVLAPMGDAIAKHLGETLSIAVLVLARFAIQAGLLIPIVALSGRNWRFGRSTNRLVWLRTGLHIIGIGAMFTSLQYLPLADAVAIAFVMPFIMLVLGHFVLGEEIGARRIIASVVGFIGTLLVVQPAFDAVGWPALLPVLVAVVFALFMLTTRAIAKDVDPISLQAVSGVKACAILVPMLALLANSGPALFEVARPSASEWGLLLAIGIIGTLAHLAMTWSLRYAPSATLAPMQYLEIPIATLIGWLVFADFPNALASLGIAITIAAGLYIVMRERATSRAAPPAV